MGLLDLFRKKPSADEMTLAEAEGLIDLVSDIIQNSDGGYPVSAFGKYDLYAIINAFKLRVANEFLHVGYGAISEDRFAEGIKLYTSIPWILMTGVVADEDRGKIPRKSIWSVINPETMQIEDERFAKGETIDSFANYCRYITADAPNYWQQIYVHLGLNYTKRSPKGNVPLLSLE